MEISKVKLRGVTKTFDSNDSNSVLNNINFEFERGNLYLINGLSGSGKTTLFNIIGTLDKPDQHKNMFEIGSFTNSEPRINYVKELIKIYKLNEVITSFKKFLLDKKTNWDDFFCLINRIILKDYTLMISHYKNNKKAYCIINEDKLIELEGKENCSENDERLVCIIILESIFYPILKLNRENNSVDSSGIKHIKMNYSNLFTKLKLIQKCDEFKINNISIQDITTEEKLIKYINKNLVSYKSDVMYQYFRNRQKHIQILEEDSDEFNKNFNGYEKLNHMKKERLNRLILETIFYPLLVQSPDFIDVKYFVENKDKEFYKWDFESKPISNYLIQTSDLRILREHCLRIIYQDFRLIESFSALDNILISDKLSEEQTKDIYELIIELFEDRESDEIYFLKEERKENTDLTYTEVFEIAKKKIYEKRKDITGMSGGQKQLVGLIRAAGSKKVKGKIFLADEPTGQMDKQLKETIYKFLFDLSKENVVIIVSHDEIKHIPYLQNEKICVLKLKDGSFQFI